MITLTKEELKVLKDIFLESDFKIHNEIRNYYINRKEEIGESMLDRDKEREKHHNEKYQFYLPILEKINLMIEEVKA
jgi:hypothetical protein